MIEKLLNCEQTDDRLLRLTQLQLSLNIFDWKFDYNFKEDVTKQDE